MKSLLMKWTLFRRKRRNALLKAKYIKSGKINRASVGPMKKVERDDIIFISLYRIINALYFFIMFRITFL